MRTPPVRLALATPIAGLAALLVSLPATPARACGGMLFPEHSERVGGMSEQELLVAFTPEHTVLIASAGYEGATAAPAFILPLGQKPDLVGQANPGFLAALDELTAPEIHITVEDDDSQGGLCGSAVSDKSGGDFNGDGDRGEVMVVERGVTTDYDWVLLAGDTGSSLADWLADNGYTLPADYAAALQPYLDADDYIFAARLKSDAAAGTTAAIELQFPKLEPGAFSIPFALAAHSLPPDKQLSITTYLIALGGLLPGNYDAAEIDRDDVIALSASESNYQTVYDAQVGRSAWVIDASTKDITPSAISDALTAMEEDHDLPPGTDRDSVFATVDDVLFAGARVTRIRTRLGAADLHDMTLTKVSGTDVSRDLFLTRDTSGGQECAIDRTRGTPLVVLLTPLLLLMRRRRR